MTNVKKDQSGQSKANEMDKKKEVEQKRPEQIQQQNQPQNQQKNEQQMQQGGGNFRGGRGGFDHRGRGRGGFEGRGRGRYDGGHGGRGGRLNNGQQGGQGQEQMNTSMNTSQSSQEGEQQQGGGRGGWRGRGRGGRGGGGERREKIVHPPAQFTEDGERMFTGRCRLFVGNLPQDMTQEDFEKMFEPFGKYQEAFINAGRGFGFIRMVSFHFVQFILFFPKILNFLLLLVTFFSDIHINVSVSGLERECLKSEESP